MTGIAIGQTVTGTGIASGSVVTVISGSTVTLNNITTAVGSPTLTFTGNCSAGTATTPNFLNAIYPTATTSAGINTLASINTFVGPQDDYIRPGDSVSGLGIAAGSRVISSDSSSQVTLDSKTLATGAGVSFAVGSVVAGTVPTKSLGLPDEYVFDGYGHAFMYVVDANATGQQTCHDMQNTGTPGTIRILPSARVLATGDTTIASRACR